MWKTILDLIFPIHCLGCNQEGYFICYSCFKKIPINKKPPLNFNQKGALDNLIIASSYKHPLIKETIHQFKYNFIKDLAEPLGLLMAKKLKEAEDNLRPKRIVLQNDVPCEARASFSGRPSESKPKSKSESNLLLIPIPLHKKRLRWRGFNQADLLAQVVSKKLNIPVNNNLLIRTKYTLPQVKIQDAKQRKQNIQQVFALNKNTEVRASRAPKRTSPKGIVLQNDVFRTSKRIALQNDVPCEARASFLRRSSGFDFTDLSDKAIILVDDISTTSATLEEAAQTLKPLQPKKIWGLVIAQG